MHYDNTITKTKELFNSLSEVGKGKKIIRYAYLQDSRTEKHWRSLQTSNWYNFIYMQFKIQSTFYPLGHITFNHSFVHVKCFAKNILRDVSVS